MTRPHRAIGLSLLALLATGVIPLAPVAPAHADSLDKFADFRSYPYLDRAYREARRENWAEVEKLMTHLLSLVPENTEARRLIVQAQTNQGHFDQALESANALPDGTQKRETLQELRIKWIETSTPTEAQIRDWLDHTVEIADREQIWRAYADALSKQPDGAQKALAWLESIKGREDGDSLRRARAIWAEQLDNWRTVIAELAPLADQGRLSPENWQRLATAYANVQDEQGLIALLPSAPDSKSQAQAQLALANRTIALGNIAVAKRWLQALPASLRDDRAQQETLWELAKATGDTNLYQVTSKNLDRPCLETAEWLSRHDAQLAKQQFARCDAQTAPQTWLILAQRLEAIDALKTQSLPARWQDERQNVLIGILRDRGEDRAAIAWLNDQPQTVETMTLSAQILQSLHDDAGAEKYWLAVYRKNGDLGALDQASYLALKHNQTGSAKKLLEQAYDQHHGQLPEALLQRLAAFYAQNIGAGDVPRVKQVLAKLDDKTRGLVLLQLASNDYCDIVKDAATGQTSETATLAALGQCAMDQTPGIASIYYQKAVDLGDQASLPSLAYALEAGGSPDAALKIWQRVPAGQMTDNARLTAARSALEAGQPDQAEHFWQQAENLTKANDWALGATIAEARNKPELALGRQKIALQNSPSPENYYAASATAQKAGDLPQSTEWLAKAHELQPDNPRYNADLGMRLASLDDTGQQNAAIPYLKRAVQDYPDDYRLHETLANRYNAVENSTGARRELEHAIDLEQNPVTQGDDFGSLDARRYRQRRAHETLERRNSVTLASTWSPAGTTELPLGNNATDRRAASQNVQTALWDHALGDEPSRNGSTFSVYGRVLTGADGHARYGQTLATGLGLRYKPLGDYNLNLYGELFSQTQRDKSGTPGIKAGDLINPGKLVDGISDLNDTHKRDNDLILRATASFLDQDEYRNDWRVGEDDWNERFVNLDLSWWTRSGNHMALSRYQQGHSFKLPTQSAQTIMPYGFVEAAAQDPNDTWRQDLRTGVGLRWQLYTDEDKYNAYRTRVNARLEYQKSVGGNLYEGADGILFGLEVNF
ncbi:NfrA family protein [Thalassospira marina]|uniref:Phage receptor n=1 Tax=Thalassospira marina TaxID=2048283 RepID=A0ABN5FM71_9PROT|nr:tetratricopeptide repeat protein [Thalassospira marina]AUG55403.1 phage receptor [Thalassospira marina]